MVRSSRGGDGILPKTEYFVTPLIAPNCRRAARMVLMRRNGSSSPSWGFSSNNLRYRFFPRRDLVLSLHLPLSEAASCFPVGFDEPSPEYRGPDEVANSASLERPRQYRPTITRLSSLILLFTLTLALIALTELACRRLPARNSEAFAVLDLKRSLRETTIILARDLNSETPAIPDVTSASNPPPTSNQVLAGTSVAGSVQPALDVFIPTSIDDPTQPLINVPVTTIINDPTQSSIDVLIDETLFDVSVPVSVPGSVPSEVPATDSPTTYTPPLKPGYPVPSVSLLGPTTELESVDTPPTSVTMFDITGDDLSDVSLRPTPTSYSTRILTAYAPDDPVWLPIGPTATPGSSAYLALDATETYHLEPSESDPADPSGGPTVSPQISDSGLAPAQPKNKDKAQDIATQNALPLAVDPSGGELIDPPVPTGVFEGESYSLGANGGVVIAGKTFDRSSPTTAVLDNGKTLAVDSHGIAVLGEEDPKTFALPSAPSGVFDGEPYSAGANGALVIGDKTLDRSSPTTAILGNGKTIEVGPSGIAIFKAEDVKTLAMLLVPSGVFEGETYSVGPNGAIILDGKTFDRSSSTTAVLSNGKTIEVGPSGIAIFGAKDSRPLPKTFAQPPARTGVFEGEAYSIGSNGVVIIGGKTFDRSSPTTAVLRNGKTVVVSLSGIAVLPADDRPPQTTALPDQAKAYAATTGVLGGETFSVGTDGKIVIGGKTFDRSSPTRAVLDDGKTVIIDPTGVAILPTKDSDSRLVRDPIAPKEYVLGAFVPVIVAVIFTIPWKILNAAVKEIEPFYQLQRNDGVTAADSLTLEYRSSINFIATFIAIRKGHLLISCSGLISIVAIVLAPLAAETVFIGFQGRCTPQSRSQACVPELNVYPVAARVLQGILSFMALLTLALAWFLHRGKTGLCANAQSIAGLATLFQNQQVIEDFRRLNPHYTTSKMISFALRDNRYRMTTFFDEDGASAYGLVKCYQDSLVNCNQDLGLMSLDSRTAFCRGKKYETVNSTATEDQERPKKHRTFSSYFTHKAVIVVFGAVIAGLEVLVIYYNQTTGDTGFEQWMNSQSFGVAFFFTVLGVLIEMYWAHLDDDMRNMEPYRRLLTGAVKANDSILLAPHSNPFSGFFYSLHKKHFFNAYVSLVAILCLPLIVALASIPFKAGLTFIAYRTSTYITIGVLSLMLIGIVWLLCRGKTPDLVRQPDTIASVLLFICGSNMREDFKGMSLMHRSEREEIITGWGKSYAMGNVIGVDGVERQAIDESAFVTTEMK